MLHIIVNPASKSGLGKEKWELLKRELNEHSIVYQVYFTKKKTGAAGCVSAILETLSKSATDNSSTRADKHLICVLGGDGTMNEVTNALYLTKPNAGKEFALAYLPTGSSNDLARALHITPSYEDFISRVKKGDVQSIDTGLMTTPSGKQRRFCVSCGIGLDAATCKEALSSKLKDTLNRIGLGKLTYAGIAIKQLISAPVTDCDIILADGSVHHLEKFLFGVAMVHPYEGGGIKFAPIADCTDGEFDICIVAGLRKWRALYLLPLAFFGKHVGKKSVYMFKSSSVTFRTGTPLVVHTDGEYAGTRQEITLTCQHNNLNYL